MKAFLRQGISRRWGYDGWALQVRGAEEPLHWSVCTTRREARELRRESIMNGLRHDVDVVKVRITVAAIDAEA